MPACAAFVQQASTLLPRELIPHFPVSLVDLAHTLRNGARLRAPVVLQAHSRLTTLRTAPSLAVPAQPAGTLHSREQTARLSVVFVVQEPTQMCCTRLHVLPALPAHSHLSRVLIPQACAVFVLKENILQKMEPPYVSFAVLAPTSMFSDRLHALPALQAHSRLSRVPIARRCAVFALKESILPWKEPTTCPLVTSAMLAATRMHLARPRACRALKAQGCPSKLSPTHMHAYSVLLASTGEPVLLWFPGPAFMGLALLGDLDPAWEKALDLALPLSQVQETVLTQLLSGIRDLAPAACILVPSVVLAPFLKTPVHPRASLALQAHFRLSRVPIAPLYAAFALKESILPWKEPTTRPLVTSAMLAATRMHLARPRACRALKVLFLKITTACLLVSAAVLEPTRTHWARPRALPALLVPFLQSKLQAPIPAALVDWVNFLPFKDPTAHQLASFAALAPIRKDGARLHATYAPQSRLPCLSEQIPRGIVLHAGQCFLGMLQMSLEMTTLL